MALVHAKPRCWTVDEFLRVAALGVFSPDERIELIDGEIVLMAPQNPPHYRAITRTNRCLVRAYGDTHQVGVQIPYQVGTHSAPEPDFVLFSLDAFERSPGSLPLADLIVEVSDTSIAYDRFEKAGLYALAGVPEYWILNLSQRQLEVHREPAAIAGEPFGHGYRQRLILPETATVAPRFRPADELLITDFMDPADPA